MRKSIHAYQIVNIVKYMKSTQRTVRIFGARFKKEPSAEELNKKFEEEIPDGWIMLELPQLKTSRDYRKDRMVYTGTVPALFVGKVKANSYKLISKIKEDFRTDSGRIYGG